MIDPWIYIQYRTDRLNDIRTAINTGDSEKFQTLFNMLLNLGEDILNYPDSKDSTIIHDLASLTLNSNNITAALCIAQQILNKKVGLNSPNKKGETPIHFLLSFACESKDLNLFGLLLEKNKIPFVNKLEEGIKAAFPHIFKDNLTPSNIIEILHNNETIIRNSGVDTKKEPIASVQTLYKCGLSASECIELMGQEGIVAKLGKLSELMNAGKTDVADKMNFAKGMVCLFYTLKTSESSIELFNFLLVSKSALNNFSLSGIKINLLPEITKKVLSFSSCGDGVLNDGFEKGLKSIISNPSIEKNADKSFSTFFQRIIDGLEKAQKSK